MVLEALACLSGLLYVAEKKHWLAAQAPASLISNLPAPELPSNPRQLPRSHGWPRRGLRVAGELELMLEALRKPVLLDARDLGEELGD